MGSKRGLLGNVMSMIQRAFGPERPQRTAAGDEPDDQGAAGAGDRSPLVPRTPVLVGAAAKQLPKVEDPPATRAIGGRVSPGTLLPP